MLDWHSSGGLPINDFFGEKGERNKSVMKLILSSEDDVDEDQVDLCGRERHICGRALIDVEENWVRALL